MNRLWVSKHQTVSIYVIFITPNKLISAGKNRIEIYVDINTCVYTILCKALYYKKSLLSSCFVSTLLLTKKNFTLKNLHQKPLSLCCFSQPNSTNFQNQRFSPKSVDFQNRPKKSTTWFHTDLKEMKCTTPFGNFHTGIDGSVTTTICHRLPSFTCLL